MKLKPAPTHLPALTRQNFLKLTGLGLLSLWLPRTKARAISLPDQEGRVASAKVNIYQKPNNASPIIGEYARDTLIRITHVTIGEGEPEHNRVWYQIGLEGFAHSGGIQPVQNSLNETVPEMPREGALAEVTVPFTDAHWRPGRENGVAYRLYYETTHWVKDRVFDQQGKSWYRILEDKWDLVYYTPCEHLRILSPSDLEPISPDVPPDAKRIEVDLERQLVTAFEWNRPIFTTRAATGAKFSSGKYYTPKGTYITNHKRPSRHMAAGNLASNGFDLPGVPWVCYFTENGVALHGTYWHNDYGRPRSHGCINLSCQAARWFYLWSLPCVPYSQQRAYEKYGTRIDIY